MANAGTIIATTTRTGGGIFSKLLSIKWSYVFIVFLFIQTVAVAVNNGENISGVVFALGETFFNIFYDIQTISQDIIQNNAHFDGVLDFLNTIWILFASVWKLYLWFKLLNWFWGRYNDSQKLFTYILSSLTFLVIEIFYLFFLVFIDSSIVAGLGFFEIIKYPYNAIIDLMKAIVLLFSSFDMEKPVESFVNTTNSSDLGVCDNLSGCVI